MQFSIRTLLAVMSAVAVVFASLVYSNQWLGDIYYTLCVAAIFMACLAAVVGQGESRLFWLGFAAAAGVYGGMTILGRSGEISNFYSYVQYGEIAGYTAELFTTRALTYSYDFIAARGGVGHDLQGRDEFERFFPFLYIGHSVLALLCGWTAGCWAAWLYRKRALAADAQRRW